MHNSKTLMPDIFRALGNEHRLVIVEWLSDPESHFPVQQDGDLVKDGVCVGFITEKIGLSQPTVTGHLQILAKAGIVTSKRIKNWVFYKLDRQRMDDATAMLSGYGKQATDSPEQP